MKKVKYHLRGKSDEKLLQIQFRVLRKRNLNPQGRMKIINVNVKRSHRVVIVDTEHVLHSRKFCAEI